jgi:diguanylate cyclase (GGDEF)-like protein
MTSDDDARQQDGEAAADEVAALRREVKELRAQLAKYSMVDPATEIASRAYFAEFFDRRWRTHARRGDQPISVVLIEPDGFEDGGETAEPHQVERWLRQIARTIEACATRAGDIAARCGEHTFAMVLSETDADGAAQIASKIQDTVDALAIPFGDGQLTVSVGLATATPTAVTGQRQFIASAERALEAAHAQGPGGRVRA